MSIKTRLKLKLKNDLQKSVERPNRGEDNRYLNFFDMKKDDKMTVLLLPDINGELWAEFKKHGPNLGVKGVGSIRCLYEATGDTCEACQMGFDALNASKETGSKEYKDLAKKWFARDYTLMSCLVLDSPVEINEASDGNEVKLFSVPFAIKEKIRQSVIEGEIDEDDIFTTPFVIKKTENSGGYASYEHSYFRRTGVTDEELEFFDDLKVDQYDYSTLDVIPNAPTADEITEWVEKAAAALNLETERTEEEEEAPRNTRSRRTRSDEEEEEGGRYQRRADKASSSDDKEDQEKTEREPEPADEDEKEERPATRKAGGSLRDRLANLK